MEQQYPIIVSTFCLVALIAVAIFVVTTVNRLAIIAKILEDARKEVENENFDPE
jgi:hypothetical protein